MREEDRRKNMKNHKKKSKDGLYVDGCDPSIHRENPTLVT